MNGGGGGREKPNKFKKPNQTKQTNNNKKTKPNKKTNPKRSIYNTNQKRMVQLEWDYLSVLVSLQSHIEKDSAAQELGSSCVIVIIILNCIIFSFTSHNYVLADSVSVLVVTCIQSFPSR